MKFRTDGVIIHETPVGEADKFVTVLTRRMGVIRVAARGSRKANGKNTSATQLLTHTDFLLQKGKSGWYADDAHPLTVFFGLKDDLEKLTLAQYFCELCGALCPREEPAEEEVRLLLNALHFLSEGTRPPALLKSVLEGRLLRGAGYMPDLDGAEGDVRFSPATGRIVSENGLPLSAAALTAFRHLLTAPVERCFSFTLSQAAQESLSAVTEAFLLSQLGRGFTTLEFYHTIHN